MALPQTGDPDLDRISQPSAGDHHSPSPGQPSTSHDYTVSATSQARLPPFWAHDPVLWFVQVDNYFCMRRITSDASKYQYVVESLPPSAASEVRDILLAPPPNNAYLTLKNAIIKRLMTSEQHRIQQLLSGQELGDRKPTQLLRHLQYLLGEKAATIDPAILRELFLQRLPSNVRVALAAAHSLPLSDLAELADSVLDVTPPIVAALPCPADTDRAEVGLLREEVSKLTALVTRLMGQPRSARRTPSPPPSPWRQRHTPSPTRPNPLSVNPSHCWYHQRFGHRARRCEHPCTWHSGNRMANR